MIANTRRCVVATGNRGKLAEIAALLGESDIELVTQAELGVAPAVEDGVTFIENALLKARHAARCTGLPAIADDSGLCVDALGGAPGIRSARWAGEGATDAANVARLLAELEGVPDAQRGAAFHCAVVALDSADDPTPAIGLGSWRGRITAAPAGTGGFGYDPVFFVQARGCTAAELAPAEKNALSHRGQALAALRAVLDARAAAR